MVQRGRLGQGYVEVSDYYRVRFVVLIRLINRKILMPKPVIRAIPSEPLDVRFNEEIENEINVDNWTEIN